MAYQRSFTDVYGGGHPAGYHRVRPQGVNVQERWVSADVESYHDAQKDRTPFIQHYVVTGVDYGTYFAEPVMKLLGNSPYTQWYKWLRSLPENANAIDV